MLSLSMSAFGGKADIPDRLDDVRFCPTADLANVETRLSRSFVWDSLERARLVGVLPSASGDPLHFSEKMGAMILETGAGA
jgi:hypothetical protein